MFLYESIILNTQCVSDVFITTVSRSKNKVKFEQLKFLWGRVLSHYGFSEEQIMQACRGEGDRPTAV